jgi:hypothetical protein
MTVQFRLVRGPLQGFQTLSGSRPDVATRVVPFMGLTSLPEYRVNALTDALVCRFPLRSFASHPFGALDIEP